MIRECCISTTFTFDLYLKLYIIRLEIGLEMELKIGLDIELKMNWI